MLVSRRGPARDDQPGGGVVGLFDDERQDSTAVGVADHEPAGVEFAGGATTASGVAQDRVAVVNGLFGFLDRDAARRELLDSCDGDTRKRDPSCPTSLRS